MRPTSDGGELDSADDKYADIVYKFDIIVSDGVSANNQTIAATVTVNPNRPSAAVTTDLPAAVTYDAEHKVHVDDDDDSTTPSANDDEDEDETDTPVDTPTYFVTAEYSDREVPVVVVDLADLVDDEDADLDYDITDDGSASHLVDSGGEILLTYLPPGSKDAPAVDVLIVDVRDGFNPDEDNDSTTTDVDESIDVTSKDSDFGITEIDKPVTSDFVTFYVMENTMDCSANADGTGACSVAGEVEGGTDYSIESGVGYTDDGTDDGTRDFAIDSNGLISVVGDIDFETSIESRKRPSFLVNVDDDFGELAGIISVSILLQNEDEAPIITLMPAGDVAWVYENFQVTDAVLTKVSTQTAPDAVNDPDTKVVASDPEGMALTYSIENKVPFSIDSDRNP